MDMKLLRGLLVQVLLYGFLHVAHSQTVDGLWGEWLNWATCTGQCGTQTRSRSCDSPAPFNGGAFCLGSNVESRSCSTGTCVTPAVRYNCVQSSISESEFQFTVRVRKDGDDSITGITAVDSSVTPTTLVTPTASSCTTSIEESSGIFALTADIDTDALSCGVTKGSGTEYKIQVHVLGTIKYFTFTCDTTKLFPSSVSLTNFATQGATGVLRHIENPFGIKAQVLSADGQEVPARSVKLGQYIKLRVIYDTGHIETGPTNMGMVFHTGFIRHSGSNLFLRIFTPGLGTNVHITGVLAGNKIDEWVVVRRRSTVEVTIPTEYQNTAATESSWIKEMRGLKIESRDCRIGVVLGAKKTNDASELVVFPDEILGKEHRPFSIDENSVDDDQEVLLVGTKASTDVTITFNTFEKPGSFKVDGTNIGNGKKDTDVSLDENEVLHIFCDRTCDQLMITSTENIAVLSGWDNQGHKARSNTKGHSSAQVIPTKYYSKKYVTTALTNGDSGYLALTEDPTDGALSVTDSVRNNVNVGSPSYDDFDITEVEYSKPVSLYKHLSDTTSITPALSHVPSIAQWGTSYYLPTEAGLKYSATIVTTKGDFAQIMLNGKSMASLSFPSSDVAKLSSSLPAVPVNYEVAVIGVTETFNFFKSSDPTKPFFMEIKKRVDGDNSLTSYLPFGVRYPDTNPCTPTTSEPGDLLDNDCDGRVDEETRNNRDDDADKKIDEDLTLNPITASFRGIYVKTLLVANNPAFSGATTVHTDGCNVITPNSKLMATIDPFKKNTQLDADFSDFWVIDTKPFKAFRFVDTDKIYFRIVFDFCVADLELCENSCKTGGGKRKRSVDDGDKFVDLMVQVTGNDTDVHVIGSDVKGQGHEARIHPCTNNAVFWVPVSLLLMTILFESAMTVYFLYKRFTLMNRLHQ